jgi:putative MFS transporter
LIAGVGIGVELVTIDAYVSELAPARLRGRAFGINQFVQFLAIPVLALVCWVLAPRTLLGLAGWRWVVFLGAVGAIAVWIIRRSIPESPRWLAQQGRRNKAQLSLTRHLKV